MRTVPTLARLLLLLVAVAAFTPSRAFAAGPLEVCTAGVPFRWPDGGLNIPWNPDQGELGSLTNAEAIALVAQAFKSWDDVPTASTTYLQGAALPVDVTLANFFPYLFPTAPDGVSAIVFDNTGDIFATLFGPNSGVLGFAGPEWMDQSTCTIVEGSAFLNGAALQGTSALGPALDIMVHEFGHYHNLAHTIVNGQILLGDTTGPTPHDTFPFAGLVSAIGNAIETMYPFYFGPGFGVSTPHKDDAVSLSTLYPAPDFFASTGTAGGRILASHRRTPRTGINVIARNVADPFLDAVSAISSDYAADFSPGARLTGVYTLRGLTPGADYAIYVDGIEAGGFSTPPGILPGTEEFYSGPGESNDALSDPPDQFVALNLGAGQTRTGINIIFNRFRPLEPMPLLDDSAFELSLPFPFYMCGKSYEELLVNANGTVSFGTPNPGFTESGAAFLAGPPQIAGAWDDLNPLAGGAVYFTESPFEFTVMFQGVPERTGAFTGTGANTFSITLKRLLNQIEIHYGALSMRDGLAGVSCGGAITSGFETPTDLSARANALLISLLFKPAVYETFTAPTTTPPSSGSPNDLSFRTLRFTPTTPYNDGWSEPNDTLQQATRIALPFDSVPVQRFTEIGGDGDVDVYRFTASAGQVIVAEILSSQLDTVLGFYNRATGALLAVDDDSGSGSLSKLTVTIPADGEYAVAVATFPDLAFTGESTGSGRYVLRVAPPPTTTSDSN
jgi:hypothetical protein